MQLIDTHAHLYDEQFDTDRKETIQNAIDSGVSKILIPNTHSEDIQKTLDICAMFPDNCFPMMGLHPVNIKSDNYKEELAVVEREIESGKYIAVGEIGLDLHWDNTYLEQQKEAFAFQVELALKHNLPISVHTRKAIGEVLEVFYDIKAKHGQLPQGVIHCYTEDLENAQKVLELGFYIGVTGIVTYKNAGIDKLIGQLPPERILLETDAPYLSPVPKRGKRNESSYLLHIAKKVADIFEMPVRKFAEISTNNACKIFKINEKS